jgi:flagellar biosynthesis/type III secretory pathway chaperone
MDWISSLAHLRTVLQREVDHAVALLEILQREYLLLTSRDSSVLEEFVKEKQKYIIALQDAGKEREQILQSAEVSLGMADIEKYIDRYTPALRPQFHELRKTLHTLAKQLRRQNEINGRVIELRRHYTERALAILQSRGSDTELYDPTAKTSHTTRSHSLARV